MSEAPHRVERDLAELPMMRKARVEHLDSFDVATAAKNTVLHDGKLTWTAARKSNLSSSDGAE